MQTRDTLPINEIQSFIRRLPKAELHLHLEGTITPATLKDLSARHDARPMTLREAKAYYRFDDFTGFIEAFKAVTRRLIDPEDYELAAWRMMERLAKQGVVHAEVYISVGVIYMWRNFDPRAFEPIFAGLERARERAARELGLSIYWIFDAVRHFTVEEAERVFRKAAEMRPLLPVDHRHRPGRRRTADRFGAVPRALWTRARGGTAADQSRRRNDRARSDPGGARDRLGTDWSRAFGDSGRRSCWRS